MWSSVVLSSGLVIFMGCAVAGVLLLKKQCHHGTTGYRILATSDSIISIIIGATLIGFALVQESNIKNTTCSKQSILMSAATFLPSFVNSFISMLLMAVECYVDSKEELQSETKLASAQKTRRKKRVTTAMLTQWFFPVIAVGILHFMTPENVIASFRSERLNASCIFQDMFPTSMEYECKLQTPVMESDSSTDNVTFSVVQRIYELIHHSVNDDSMHEPVPHPLPDLPQTKEEWRDILQVPVEAMERGQRGVKTKDLTDNTWTACDKTCMMSLNKAHIYFLSVLLSIYIIPMLATVTLHHSMKMKNKSNRAINLESSETLSTKEPKKECHLSEIKMMALSNFVMWTPSLIEKLIKKWLCNSPPQWLVAILFIMGQMTSVIRGLINAKSIAMEQALQTNVVVPFNTESDSSTQTPAQSNDNNSEILFHKRQQETEQSK